MLKDKDHKTDAVSSEVTEENKKEETSVSTDWAEEASHELQDYIEEQGIYIRY